MMEKIRDILEQSGMRVKEMFCATGGGGKYINIYFSVEDPEADLEDEL